MKLKICRTFFPVYALSAFRSRVEKKDFSRNYAVCTIWPIWPCPITQEPLPLGLWNLQFGRPFLDHHYYILSLSDLCLHGSREEDFQRYNAFPQCDIPGLGLFQNKLNVNYIPFFKWVCLHKFKNIYMYMK